MPRSKKGISDRPGSIIDRSQDSIYMTAKHVPKVLVGEYFGSTVLSTVAGFVDTSGFLALFELFTAHVTGDLIIAAVSFAKKLNGGAVVRLAMIPIFMISVAAVSLFARAIKRRGAKTVAPLLSLMTLALALFTLAGTYLYRYANNPGSWGVAVIGGLGVIAMGVQNALMRGALRSFSQTTIMTGNLTQFTIDFVDFAFPPSIPDRKERDKIKHDAARNARKSGFPLLGFMIGAGFGAYLTRRYGLVSIALPTAAVGILSIIAWWRERKI